MKRLLLSFVLATVCCEAQASTPAKLPDLIHTIILAESSGNPRAIGDGGSSRGLMQISRAAWKRHTSLSFDKAFDPALNRTVGSAILAEIIRTYRARGINPPEAYVIFTYNTGSYIRHYLPKTDKRGRPHPWTIAHPNKVYRAVYRQHFQDGSES